MEKGASLFRKEVLNNRFRSLGSVNINTPIQYQLVGIFSSVLLILILMFLFFAGMYEKVVVKGYLDADKGIVTVHSQQSATLLESFIREGQHVRKGDVLLLMSNGDQKNTKRVVENICSQIKNLKQEYQLKKDHYQAMNKLYQNHFVPISSLQRIRSELLEISNKIKTMDLERTNYENKLYRPIKAPSSGIVTNILFKKNQVAKAYKTLLQIIPDESQLIARLYVPVQDSGFLKKNAQVFIRYDAYPSQGFGGQEALIKEINLSILTDKEEDKPIKIGQPYYKIQAQLEKSSIYGSSRKMHLSYGMTLTAVIRGEKKKLWQWIVTPMLGLIRNVF